MLFRSRGWALPIRSSQNRRPPLGASLRENPSQPRNLPRLVHLTERRAQRNIIRIIRPWMAPWPWLKAEVAELYRVCPMWGKLYRNGHFGTHVGAKNLRFSGLSSGFKSLLRGHFFFCRSKAFVAERRPWGKRGASSPGSTKAAVSRNVEHAFEGTIF